MPAFFAFFPLVQCLNELFFHLDDLFFPERSRIPIRQPIFIVGNPRSGTTFLHRLLSQDEARFFYFKVWEMAFPAIVQKKLLAAIGRIDQRMGHPMKRAILRYEAEHLSEFAKMHQTGLFMAEEDDKLLIHAFASFDLIWLFPFLEEFEELTYFDIAARDNDRTRAMQFYRECVQRQAFFSGRQKQFISKNPHFTPRIGSLYKFFPDCKIVYLVRNPLEVVPSMINMAHAMWRSTAGLVQGYPFSEKIYELAQFNYRYPLQRLAEAPPESYAIVKYADLVSHPAGTVHQIFKHFGFPVEDRLRSILAREEQNARNYRSRHVYSLEQTGIDKNRIVQDLSFIFERFGFDKNQP